MRISEIFYSIEGEGSRAGSPCIFIRKHNCNLSCSYCDSNYACDGNDYREMSVDDIMEEVLSFGDCKRVTITGGEPLYSDREYSHISKYLEELETLLEKLTQCGKEINIETNGSIIPPQDWKTKYNLFYTYDFKCPSSGMMEEMQIHEFLHTLKDDDCLKFVVGDEEDLNTAKRILVNAIVNGCKYPFDFGIYISPVFGKIELKTIVDFILKYHMDYVKLNVQLHKLVWDPSARGV